MNVNTSREQNELSTQRHWDEVWAGHAERRLPSRLLISTRDLQRLLRKHVRPGDRFLEVGCAPGKMLAWVSAVLGAEVSGLDYANPGLAATRDLFAALNLRADLRCEDLGRTTFMPGSFDVVFSAGVIEHFDDPQPIVLDHLRLLRPGGLLLVTIPDYSGLYGRLQAYFDAASLEIHNLRLMNPAALRGVVSPGECAAIRTYRFGRLSPWVLTPQVRWPGSIATVVSFGLNALALLQPFDFPPLCPMLVLEARRRRPI
jgi:2-polyprenyl-3-methyl-5-hydroxy-6-metoxy-1,4-benzoquinol methylase